MVSASSEDVAMSFVVMEKKAQVLSKKKNYSSFEYVVLVKEVHLSKPNAVAPLNGQSRVAVCVAVCVAVVLQSVL